MPFINNKGVNMFKHLCLSVALFLSVIVNSYAETAQINNIFSAVVKVEDGRTFGSGGCINIDDKYVYIITNHHVAGGVGNDVSLFFYRDGHESVKIAGQVIWTAYLKNQPVDISLIKVPLKSLYGWRPNVIQFTDDKIKEDQPCITIGCPKAEWPKAVKGHIVKNQGGTYLISPTVVPGQSGSVLFNEDGTKAIGLIAWYEGNYGKAMTADTIKEAALGKQSNYYYNQPYGLSDQPIIGWPIAYKDQTVPFFRNLCPNCPNDNENPEEPREPNTPRRNNNNTPPPDDGTDKIFPTRPEDPDKEFDNKPVPPAPKEPAQPVEPEKPKVDLLDQYKTENNKKFSELEQKIKGLEDRINKDAQTSEQSRQNILNKITEITGQLGKFKDIQDQINKILMIVNGLPTDGKVITPGNIHDNIRPELDNLSKSIDTKLAEYSEIISKNTVTPGKLDDVMNNLKKDVDTAKQQLASFTSKINDVQKEVSTKETTTTNIIKEVLADNTNDKYVTIGGLTIPWGVLLILGYFLKGRLGGGATQNPFPNKIVLLKK